jgi:hypothetical protein
MDTTDELDLSWIQEEETILSGLGFELKQMKEIRLVYIYINQNDYLSTLEQEIKVLPLQSIIQVSELMAIIQKHKLSTPTSRYRLIDLLLFHMDGPFDKDSPLPQLKSTSMINDITLQPSPLVFHSVNTLYFIYKECPLVMNAATRSILRPIDPVVSTSVSSSTSTSEPKQGKTKRVKMNPQQMYRFTKKNNDKENL